MKVSLVPQNPSAGHDQPRFVRDPSVFREAGTPWGDKKPGLVQPEQAGVHRPAHIIDDGDVAVVKGGRQRSHDVSLNLDRGARCPAFIETEIAVCLTVGKCSGIMAVDDNGDPAQQMPQILNGPQAERLKSIDSPILNPKTEYHDRDPMLLT